MTLLEALKDAQRSKTFVVASKAKDLDLKLEHIKDLYGDQVMARLVR